MGKLLLNDVEVGVINIDRMAPDGIVREIDSNGKLTLPMNPFTFKLPGVTTINKYGLNNAFDHCTGLKNVKLNDLTTINGTMALYSAFSNCPNLTNVDLSNLTTISNNASYSLAYCFSNCVSLTNVNFNSLNSIKGSFALDTSFRNCISLQTVSFPALTSTAFGNNYTNQFSNMLSGVTGCTIHYPSNLQSVIGSWSSVTNGFGGTNTTVLFDLPATT